MIVRRLEELAVENGFLHAILETGKDLKPAIELYKSLGYNVVGNYAQYDNDPICVCMKRKLFP